MKIIEKLNKKEFLKTLSEMTVIFRATIEAEVEGFDPNETAKIERIKKVNDPVDGFRFFAKTYFPHYIKNPEHESVVQQYFYSELPKAMHDKLGIKQVTAAPRGEAKSTICSQLFPIYCIVTEQKHYIGIVMDAWEQSTIMVEAIKAELESNPRLKMDFPDVVGKGRIWREGLIVTKNNRRVEGFGSGKKIRGRRHGAYRPDLIVIDDVENDENVRSPDQRDKLENWILKAVLELGPPDGSMDVFMVGTVLHHDSVLSRFLIRAGWKARKFQAVIKWPDDMSLWEQFEEIFINEGEDDALEFYKTNKTAMDKGAVVSWPGVRPLINLMLKRISVGASSFDSEYQNNPTATDATFTNFTYYIEPSRDWVFFGAVDPSLGIKGKQGRDPSAILVGGYDRVNKRLDIIEALIRKRVPDLIINDTIAMQKQYNCVAWFVEAVQFQEFFRTQLMKTAIGLGVSVPAYPVIPNTDKHLRIETLQPHVEAGNIRFRQEHRILLEQLKHFPKASHDDGPDCLEMLWINAIKLATPSDIQVAPTNNGFDSLNDFIGGGYE